MSRTPIASSFVEQFERAWVMWHDTIADVPDDHWATGEDDYLIPARQAYHTIMAAERYVSDLPSAEYMATRKYGLDWMGPAVEMPSKRELLSDLEWIQDKTKDWLERTGDEGLLQKETLSPWAGERVLDRALYLLRHTHHHLGELAAELKRRDIPRAPWK
jgi:hypothetical protein